jgi:ATP-dependent RNA helicase RhlE
MHPNIRKLANKILINPTEISIAIAKPAEGILQQAYLVYDEQKVSLIRQILKTGQFPSVIIFASKKEYVKKLEQTLLRAGLPVRAFHSDLEQAEREDILRAFKSKQINVIIGTDVLSRGIDVEGISLVVNYDVPPDPEDYVHRIGRTARAETTGTAITFINDKDQRKFLGIENMIGKTIPKLPLPDGMGEGPAYQPEVRPKRSFNDKKPFKKSFRRR